MTTSGTIGVTAQENARFTAFTRSLNGLRRPEGTVTRWGMSGDNVFNCNTLAREMEGDWLWLIADDHSFAPDLLEGLLARDVDIVVPLCLRRQKPFLPVIYAGRHADELIPVDLHTQPSSGLINVYAAGSAGMLIRREVFQAIPEPWFKWDGDVGEDIYFCEKAREHGFEIHCDLDQPLGHLTTASVWPAHVQRWGVGLSVADDFNFMAEFPRSSAIVLPGDF